MKKKTNKQKFDDVQEKIETDHRKANGLNTKEQDAELDEEAETFEKNLEEAGEKGIDKTMGTKKITVTKEEYEDYKQDKQQQNFLNNAQRLKRKLTSHLSNDESNVIQKVMQKMQHGKLTDPVLKHVAAQRVVKSQEYAEEGLRVKVMQKSLLDELNKVADNLVKCQGAIESADLQILDLVKKNPALIAD